MLLDGKMFLTFFSVVFILIGILYVIPSTSVALIKFNNTLRGTKTNINKGTLLFYQITGIIFIVVGLILLSSSWNRSTILQNNPTHLITPSPLDLPLNLKK